MVGFDKNRLLVTFDDGYLDNWVHAHPVLAEFGQRATIFLITGWIGDGPARSGTPEVPTHKQAMAAAAEGKLDDAFMRWTEVEAMRAAGTADFHSHTHTHTRWDRQIADQATRDAALAEDLAASRATLAARLGEATPHLCWPQGYYDAAYQRIARAVSVTSTPPTMASFGPAQNFRACRDWWPRTGVPAGSAGGCRSTVVRGGRRSISASSRGSGTDAPASARTPSLSLAAS